MSDNVNVSFINTEKLRKRWGKKNRKAVRKIIHQYLDILKPIKLGKEILIDPKNIKIFELNQRIVKK